MLRNAFIGLGFSSGRNIEGKINFRKDSYNAIHLTPMQALPQPFFQGYISDLLKETSVSNTSNTTSIWVHLTANNLSLIH